MTKICFRDLRAGDIAHLAENLRTPDRQELMAARGDDVVFTDAIAHAVLRSSHVWVAEAADGEPVAIFGVVPLSLLGGRGSPWFLATERAFEYPRNLVADGRRYLSRMRAIYPTLHNYVDARNERSIRWLRRMGFTLHAPVPYGVGGLPFHKFDIGGPD